MSANSRILEQISAPKVPDDYHRYKKAISYFFRDGLFFESLLAPRKRKVFRWA